MTEVGRPTLPGFWKFFWMFWMQPVTLHHRLKACGIDEPGTPGWKLVRAAVQGENERIYLQRLIGVFAAVVPLASALFVCLRTSSVPLDPQEFVLGVAVGVVFGVAFGVALGVALGVIHGVTLGVALGVAFGVAGGVVLGVVGGLGLGLSFIAAALLSFLRLPIFVVEANVQTLLYRWQVLSGKTTLRYAPILHHDLSYCPHPFLGQHIVLTAESDLALARRALDACSVSPGQRRAGQLALAQLQARELESAIRKQRFSSILELRGTWLPGTEDADPLLLGFAEVVRYLASAAETAIPFHRVRKLELAAHETQSLRNRLFDTAGSPLAKALKSGPFPILEQVVADLQCKATAAAAEQLPNPFRAGEPLNPEEGAETFRGREELVRTLETLLGEPGRGASIALLGPRRCGKTSLLKMLPHLLPDAICVLFDLQDNPIDSPASFFSALERRAREQARRDRQINLPKLPQGSPFEAGSRWLEALDEQAGPRRILLCLDEFERLESLFPGSRQELLQLMGLLRATIQHRRHIRLLVSGAAPFDELDDLWNDHLINVREVKIGHLDQETTLGLLRKPIPAFPEDAIPEEVAREIFARTAGQPYLVQLYGSLLVTRLNQEDRRVAALADVPRVEEDVLQQATYYLRSTLQGAPPAARAALLDLAHDGEPRLDPPARRWLRRRLLLTEDDRLSIPVLGAWIRAEEAD